MTVSNARDNLKSARRELAEAIDSLPSRLFSLSSRSKRSRIRRAIECIDKSLQALR